MLSCHIPANGFSFPEPLSPAYTGSDGFRNAPTLINTVYKEVWFHDGRIGTNLNDVVRENITEDWLMNMDMRLMQERLKQDPIYVEMFKAANLGEPSNGGVRKALPEYLKTLTSINVPFDQGDLNDLATQGSNCSLGKRGVVNATVVLCSRMERHTIRVYRKTMRYFLIRCDINRFLLTACLWAFKITFR